MDAKTRRSRFTDASHLLLLALATTPLLTACPPTEPETPVPVDGDGDGYTSDEDCDDRDATVHPNADELCGDGVDNDCDAEIDDGCTSPFSRVAVLRGTTVAEATEALARFIHGVDDRERGLPADWVVAGAGELPPGEEPTAAVLRLPGGTRVIEVCNGMYAGQAMSFGGHHGVALPCEIALSPSGDDVEVVMLNPEGIFNVFFRDVPAEHAAGMGELAATVRAELEGLVADGLAGFAGSFPVTDVGPSRSEEDLRAVTEGVEYSVVLDVAIPWDYRGSDERRQAFKEMALEVLLETLTHEGMAQVGSRVEGLSVGDWRSPRSAPLALPGGVSVVEMCSPSYAGAAMSTGTHHAPALPCEAAVWVDGDMLRVHLLDPTFIFPVFFADAPAEMMAEMGGMAAAVRQDLVRIVEAALEAALAG